jgi:hypothetical protein
MANRGAREAVVRGLAKVSLVWAAVVLGALFMATSALGQHHDGGYTLTATGAHHRLAATSGPADAPSTAGLALVLVIVGVGIAVLALGISRGAREAGPGYDADPARNAFAQLTG